jgi:hypothetical protein
MRIRGLIVATLIFFVLAGVLYWSNRHQPEEQPAKTSANTPPAILKLDQASITKLELKNKDAEPIVLAKNNDGRWRITEPTPLNADQTSVSSALSSLSSLNSERLVDEKAANLKQYGLDQPAVEIDVAEKDGKAQKLLIGDDTPAGSSVYAMLAGDPRVFTMASYAKSSIDKTVHDLRDKRLLTVSPDKISRIELVRKTQTIEFGRDKDEWQILKPKPLRADSFQVDELARKLTNARMDLTGSADDAKQATAAFARATPIATAKLTDQSGTQALQIRLDKKEGKDKDNANNGTYYARSSVVDGAFKIDPDLGHALDKGLDDFRNKKLFDLGFSEPAKIELHNGSKAYFLSKGGSDWWSDGKKMDADSIQDLISDLRDLTASKFVDSGFSNPAIELAVTSEDGKRVEKVSIAKSGSNYIAKRENDPTLYQLDSGPVDAIEKAADGIKPAATPSK